MSEDCIWHNWAVYRRAQVIKWLCHWLIGGKIRVDGDKLDTLRERDNIVQKEFDRHNEKMVSGLNACLLWVH